MALSSDKKGDIQMNAPKRIAKMYTTQNEILAYYIETLKKKGKVVKVKQGRKERIV